MKIKPRPEVGIPCATCPFLKVNFGKPNPPGFETATAEHLEDWYSPENARRLWKGLETENWLMCHSSDPEASTYGGAKHSPGKERLCVGELTALMKHLKRIEALVTQDPTGWYRKYKKEAGRAAFRKATALRLVMTIAMGRTQLFGGLPFPKTVDTKTIAEVGVPWEDVIANG